MSLLAVAVSGRGVVDPAEPELAERMAGEYAQRRAHKGVTLDAARDVVAQPSYFGTLMVLLEPSPAEGRATRPLTSRSKRPGSPAGSITFSSVNRAGNQLPKSSPRAFGTSATSSGPHAHGNRPSSALPVPPGVLSLGKEQTQSVATGCVRLRRNNVVSRR